MEWAISEYREFLSLKVLKEPLVDFYVVIIV